MRHAIRKVGAQGANPKPYDERTFRYLHALEQRRSNRSGRPFVLVLVGLKAGLTGPLEPAIATTIFSALSRCLRETDFIGWYDQDRRAGAVLTELGGDGSADALKVVHEKVITRGLLEYLPDDLKARLELRVARYPATGRP